MMPAMAVRYRGQRTAQRSDSYRQSIRARWYVQKWQLCPRRIAGEDGRRTPCVVRRDLVPVGRAQAEVLAPPRLQHEVEAAGVEGVRVGEDAVPVAGQGPVAAPATEWRQFRGNHQLTRRSFLTWRPE